jgi:hypothetical protein
MSNNLYYGSGYWWDNRSNNTYSTLATWQTAMATSCGGSQCDLNSIYANPLFTNAAGNDFTLQSTSPAIDTGVNLGSTYDLGLAPGSTWPAGVLTLNQNTNGLGWDIGAYVYTETTVPTVTLTAPSDGSTVSGSSVPLSATASDNSAVAGVQFKLDTNTDIGTEDTSSPYSVTWDSTGVADGSHTIVAVARDTYGNYATSSLITLTVHNALPTPVSYGGGGPIYGSGPLAPGYQVVVPTITTPSISSSTSAVSIPSSTTSNKGIILTKNHQIWDRGEDILTLQKWLNAHGFIIALAGPGSPGSETPIFGTLTYKTLIRFQNSKALPPTGYLGPLTRAALAVFK